MYVYLNIPITIRIYSPKYTNLYVYNYSTLECFLSKITTFNYVISTKCAHTIIIDIINWSFTSLSSLPIPVLYRYNLPGLYHR